MEIALSVKNVVKKYGDFTAVNDVSFNVEDGKFFSILGPSGCGKTTLLRMIAGFFEPTAGSIEIRGKNMANVPPNKRPVNLVFQHLALFPMMDVKENIAFGLRRRGEKTPEVMKKVHNILERVGLPEYADKRIDQLSGGQKQRVAIARCLVLEPAVLLLDEPLGALDLKLREHMKVELKKLQAEIGTTFVYITHDQSEAMVMSNGHFEQIDSPSNLYNNPASSFVAMFVGNNNKVTGVLAKDESGKFFVQDKNQLKYAISTVKDCKEGDVVGMYTRPEAIIINPAEDKTFFNRTGVHVKAVLFDGGNSRLLVVTPTGQEVLVALPQNHQFDYIKKGDDIMIGWDPASSVCFKETGAKMYDDEI